MTRLNGGLIHHSPAAAKAAASAFLVYCVVMNIISGWNVPSVLMSRAGLNATAGISALMAAGAVSHLLPGGAARGRGRLAAAVKFLLWIGLAASLFSIPRGINEKNRQIFLVTEFQSTPPNFLEGLSELKFGKMTLASKGDNVLLSKKVEIDTKASMLEGDKLFRIGLFPPTRIGAWRLTVNRFGYVPYIDWRDKKGKPVINNWIMLGTYPRMVTYMDLVDWIPNINLMLGVGYYPPRRDDMFYVRDNPYRVYVRIEEAIIKGKRRKMTDPEAHVFLCDGRPENPIYYVKIFDEYKTVYEKRIKPGEVVEFQGGTVRLSSNFILWAEIQAQKNPWASAVAAGFACMLLSLTLWVMTPPIRVLKRLLLSGDEK